LVRNVVFQKQDGRREAVDYFNPLGAESLFACTRYSASHRQNHQKSTEKICYKMFWIIQLSRNRVRKVRICV